jgi:anti-sigma regulatory factor (Ser/Thr protein kinase)
MRWPWAADANQRDALRVAAREFDDEGLAARTARHFTTRVLGGWSMLDLIDDAALAVSELVTNALRHGLRHRSIAACPVRLLMFGSYRALLCLVTDPSAEPPILREPDYVAETGRGLQVVAGVSRMWGWAPLDPAGKAVWAGFTTEETPAGVRAAATAAVARLTGTAATSGRPRR